MTSNKLVNNINKKVHEFGFGYVTYHSLMGIISECTKEYEQDNKNNIKQLDNELTQVVRHLIQENKQLKNRIECLSNPNGHWGNFS